MDTSDALVARDHRQAVAIVNGTTIPVREFVDDIEACAESLPNARHVIDLCGDRYGFIVRFLAVLVRGQTNLLPSRRDSIALANARRTFHDTHVATVSPARREGFPRSRTDALLRTAVDPRRPAAIAFTSGTTGVPDPHPKTWRMLDSFRAVHARYLASWLGKPDGSEVGIVATVPPWHMYGLEWTLLLPTVAPAVLYCDDTFYPKDVKAALDRFDARTLLVTTPTHLRAMLKTPAPTRSVDLTLCATSPLDPHVARQAETHLGTRVIDLYGCTEIGSLATRRLTCQKEWTFFDCFDLELERNRLTVGARFLESPVTLSDSFSALGCGRYQLEGRTTDIVKVGGKRESLGNLNTVLLRIPGVEDGIVYDPAALGLPATGRLAAVVVAPALDAQSIRRHLANAIDSVFIPRPIRLVGSLPREATSKLSATALRQLLAAL